ncbi:hypothetical protein GOB86_10895 [Acetobacter lambici]|uniref:Uncharacterized protein n=1 Tax=Acetobacter lambici TaxID=1332824 RepID=A0ABT1F0S8_9PROT|nr:hypothetical protein [Acetobacter lambici]MCP1241764.1 hypothetical protein [Acetobacter lambici]MCP1257889.1 hypothetical protein [Acetobacter lambici]NHO57554.1 hypothetical protein [Acetobacter lambici]
MAAAPSNSSRAASTVTVICRMPAGLVLDLYDTAALAARASAPNPVMAPPKPTASVRLDGAKADPRYHGRDNLLLGMGGRTQVDAAFWQAWCAQNPNFLPLKNGLIFAQPTERDAGAELAERGQHRSGLEGLEPASLPGVTPFARDVA